VPDVPDVPDLKTRTWTRDRDWYDQSRAWQFRPPADLHGSVSPDTAEAASGHTFTVTLKCGASLTLEAGAHITLEVPETWDAHLGNCYRRGIKTVGARNQIVVGYGAFVDVSCSNPEVALDVAVSWGRFFDLIDVVVTGGTVRPGDEIQLILGPEDGNLVQVQKHAQVAVLHTGVDITGAGAYLAAATQPTVRVIGATAERLRVFAPAVVIPGEQFGVRVLPVDLYSHNPSSGHAGQVQTFGAEGLTLPPTVEVRTDAAPQATSFSASASQPGVYRISVLDSLTGIAGRSNPIGVGFFADRSQHVLFGELHSQMWHSMGTGTTEEFFRWGRDVAGLDFCGPANHYNHRFELTDEIWQELVDTTNRFNDPGHFATLVSYEWGGINHSGHKNVYYRGAEGEFAYWYRRVHRSPDDLWESLAGRDALTIPHHTKFGSPTDWRFRNDRHQRLVEICSLWGISEEGGPHSVQAALAMGHRVGFIGGTDSHYGLANQGSYHVNDGNGLACVIAAEVTRDAIWRALWDRHCYATTGDRILLDFRLGGHSMGTDIETDLGENGLRHFSVRVAGTHTLEKVQILRNNEVVFSTEPKAEDWVGEWVDGESLAELALAPTFPRDRPFVFYYLRAYQRNRQQAWSSPIWLTQRI
jgi:hypothetical protein